MRLEDELFHKKLDAVVLANYPKFSRSQILKMIKAGGVTVNGIVEKNRNTLIMKDDEFEIDPKTIEIPDQKLLPQDISLNILFEDDDIIVIDKPTGMVVHPGAGNWDNTVLNAVLGMYPNSSPVAINRLDKDTSGVMFIAKHSESKTYYAKKFEQREVYKKYICVCGNNFLDQSLKRVNGGTKIRELFDDNEGFHLYGFIDRHPIDRKKMYFYNFSASDVFNKYDFLKESKRNPSLKKSSRYAESEIHLINEKDNYVALEILLKTGRKHQIRAQLKAFNSPILGDTIYGGDDFERLMLHSYRTKLMMKNGKYMQFEAKIPDIFGKFIDLSEIK
jgi:23S rRNA pseudouridine1911/1915/1917 synthase